MSDFYIWKIDFMYWMPDVYFARYKITSEDTRTYTIKFDKVLLSTHESFTFAPTLHWRKLEDKQVLLEDFVMEYGGAEYNRAVFALMSELIRYTSQTADHVGALLSQLKADVVSGESD